MHLDIVPPGPEWENFPEIARCANGHVFASWAAYVEAPFDRKFFFEGGTNCALQTSQGLNLEHRDKIIVYAGGASQDKGLEQLLAAFCLLESSSAKLVVCGKGTDQSVFRNKYRSDRILFRGFVSDVEFDQICRQAYCFVNPRCADSTNNKYNFPSKLLLYLKYSKPIISYWTDGLPPEYREAIISPASQDISGLAQQLKDVLGWSPSKYGHATNILRTFALERSWKLSTSRLMHKLASLASEQEVAVCA